MVGSGSRIGWGATPASYSRRAHYNIGGAGHTDRTGWGGPSLRPGDTPGTLFYGAHRIQVDAGHIRFNGVPVTLARHGLHGSTQIPGGPLIRATFHPRTGKLSTVTITDSQGRGWRFSFDEHGNMRAPQLIRPGQIRPASFRPGSGGPAEAPSGGTSSARRHARGGRSSGSPGETQPRVADSGGQTQPIAFSFPPEFASMMTTLDRIKTDKTADAQTVSALQAQLDQLGASIDNYQGQLSPADLQKIRDLGAAFMAAADALPANMQTIADQLRTMGRPLLPSSSQAT
jgi:hypothetical protein